MIVILNESTSVYWGVLANKIFPVLPEQGLCLQICVSERCPVQVAPPLRGWGLVHERKRRLKPFPQVLLHRDHVLQDVQPPLTVKHDREQTSQHSNCKSFEAKVKEKGAPNFNWASRRPIRPTLSSGFWGMKRLGVFVLPLDGILVHRGLSPSI